MSIQQPMLFFRLWHKHIVFMETCQTVSESHSKVQFYNSEVMYSKQMSLI